jgi:hypothetical protein
MMSHGSSDILVMLRRKESTMDGWVVSPVNRKPGAATAEMLSA